MTKKVEMKAKKRGEINQKNLMGLVGIREISTG